MASDQYSVYDSRGRRLARGVDRESAMREKRRARANGDGGATVIRQGQDKQLSPNRLRHHE